MDHTDYAYNDWTVQPDPPHQPLYLSKLLRYLGDDSRISTVLDAGCGDGNFTASLAAEGYEVYGLDMSESGVRLARERDVGRFEQSSLYASFTEPFLEIDSFDAVVAVEVVEHLYSPRTFVANAFDALRPGGRLILTTPYWGYWKNLALAITGQTDRLLTALWDGGHIKHWSRKTMTTLLSEQGFEVIAFEGAGRAPYLWRGMVNVAIKPESGDDQA